MQWRCTAQCLCQRAPKYPQNSPAVLIRPPWLKSALFWSEVCVCARVRERDCSVLIIVIDILRNYAFHSLSGEDVQAGVEGEPEPRGKDGETKQHLQQAYNHKHLTGINLIENTKHVVGAVSVSTPPRHQHSHPRLDW